MEAMKTDRFKMKENDLHDYHSFVEMVIKYKGDEWGEVLNTELVFIDSLKHVLMFEMKCEGHGGLVIVTNNDKPQPFTTKDDKTSFSKVSNTLTYHFYEEDCAFALAINQMDNQQRQAVREYSSEDETTVNNILHIARRTLESYYKDTRVNF